ncbi:MAG: AsmA family protein [Magnetococcus sp. MYC-9]
MSVYEKSVPHNQRTLRVLYLLGGIGLLFFLSTALFISWLVDVERYRPALINTLEKMTGHSVSLEGISLAPTEGFFTLELHNLQIQAASSADPPLLAVKKVQVGVTTSFFLRQYSKDLSLEVTSLKFSNPRITLVQRDDIWLVQLLQDTVGQVDRRMKQLQGWGLTSLAVHAIRIQNGSVTLLNWEHAAGHALVFDRIYADIHALSASHASPMSLSARFQSVPFTLAGQIGPLPDSLELAEMPVLLNLEAKSTNLFHFIDFFANFSNLFIARSQPVQLPQDLEIRGARGYFSTLFNGTLKKGMQTSARVELDRMTVTTRTGQQPPPTTHQASPPTSPNISTRWPKRENPPTDLAMRLKSVLRVEQERPLLQVDECYVYLDGKPTLDIKGVLQGKEPESDQETVIDLAVATLNSFNIKRFPHPWLPYFAGESPQGTLHLQGEWPSRMQWSGHLDFSQTEILLPPVVAPTHAPRSGHQEPHALLSMAQTLGLEKAAGVPLLLEGSLRQEPSEDQQELWVLQEFMASRPPTAETPGLRLRVSGTVQPTVQLELAGEWELSLLKEYLAGMAGWDISGVARLDASLRVDEQRTGETPGTQARNHINGQLHVGDGQFAGVDFQEISARIKQENGVLRLTDLEADMGMGRLDAQILVDFSTQPATYQAAFAFAGIAMEELTRDSQSGIVGLSAIRQAGRRQVPKAIPRPAPKQTTPHPLLEGLAFGQGEIGGHLNAHGQSVLPLSGMVHLEIEPGRMMDLHAERFLTPPVTAQHLFGQEKKDPPAEGGVEKGRNRESGLARKALYWDHLVADLLWHDRTVQVDNLRIRSAGLQLTGSGEWNPAGQHRFELQVQSPLRPRKEPFHVWLEGDREHAVYRPGAQPGVLPPIRQEP